MKIRHLLSLFLLLLGMPTLMAQTPTTEGRDFWVSYMKNGHRNSSVDRITLIVSAKEDCVVTAVNKNANPPQTLSIPVQAGEVVIRQIPDNMGYNSQNEGVANTGIHVTSDKDISLYIGNEANNSYDAANVLPTDALGTFYMIQTSNSVHFPNSTHTNNMRASFLVIATEDNTIVQITPTVATPEHRAGETYTVALNEGQVYHVMTREASTQGNTNGDFTGTLVVANNRVSVFNGNCLVSIPGGLDTGYDQVFEQAMPTNYWGKKFVVTSSGFVNHGVGDDQVKITASGANTEVFRDGNHLCSLTEGESFTFSMNLSTEPCTYLESDQPIAVYLYNHSHGASYPQYGDPSMVWISPVEQTIEEVSFSTFQVQEVNYHYVNIVCYTENVSAINFDGVDIASEFSLVPGNNELSYVRKNIPHGSHTLRCPGGFVAYVYGIGEAEGYAYTVGSSAKVLTTQLFVNGEPYENYIEGFNTCRNNPVQFRAEANFAIHHVDWNFGDGNTATGETVTHAFDDEGTYFVSAMVYKTPEFFESPSAVVHVSNEVHYSIDQISCDIPAGEYIDTLQTVMGCDSIVHTIVTPAAPNMGTIDAIACGEYVFRDSVYTVSGQYEYLVEKEVGCDSLYVLNLTIGNPPAHPEITLPSCDSIFYWGYWLNKTVDTTFTFTTAEGCVYDSILHFVLLPSGDTYDTIVACDSYSWFNGTNVVTLFDSDDYHATITGDNGCESRFHLHLTINDSPPFNRILGLGNVAIATTYWPGEYIYFLDDTLGMDTSTVTWTLSDNANGEWEFHPHGASCTIVTYTLGTKTLTATTGHEACDRTVSKSINCSGFDVDESMLGSLKIYPNPARNELIVEGEGLKRVSLINLLGQRLREVPAEGMGEVRLSVDDLPQALYLVEVVTRYGNKTQRISVIR